MGRAALVLLLILSFARPNRTKPWQRKTDLQAEHGVDSGARGLGRRRSAFQRRRLCGRLIRGGRRSRGRSTGSCNARRGSSWLGGKLLEISEIARLFRARLNGGKRQIHLMLHGAGNAVQLPDELFEFFGTAELKVAVPEKTDGQDEENGQADGESGEDDALE